MSENRKELTARQAEILDFMKEYLRENDNMPPYREICHRFGFKSTNAVAKHIEYITKKGYLERVRLRYDPQIRSNMFRIAR